MKDAVGKKDGLLHIVGDKKDRAGGFIPNAQQK